MSGLESGLIVRCGTVVAASATDCRVAMERERCAGCEGGCRVGLSWLGAAELSVVAAPPPPVGARVAVGVPRRGIAQAAMAIFGLPLAGMIAGSWLAAAWQASDGGALLGFALGAGAGVLVARRSGLAARAKPRLVARREAPNA